MALVVAGGVGRTGPRARRRVRPVSPIVGDGVQSHLSGVRGLLALSLLMMDRRDEREVVHLMASAVPALAACRALGVLLHQGDWTPTGPISGGAQAAIAAARATLSGAGGPLLLPGEGWAWALPMATRNSLIGHLVVAAESAPGDDELVLLRSLAQQTGVAVANARLHVSKELVNAALAETVSALEYKTAIHDRFTQVALTGGGYSGIVDALSELTGLSAGIEDRHGNLLAWTAPDGLDAAGRAVAVPAGRAALVERSLATGHPVRGNGRVLVAVRIQQDVVGVLFLLDPDGVVGEAETVALEHGGTVLAIELARLLSVTETELRLGVDVLTDLVNGTDIPGATRRAQALGRDLSRPQRAVTIGVHRSRIEPDALLHLVRAAVPGPHPALLMHRGDDMVVLLEVRSASDRASVQALASGLRAAAGGRSFRVGVGGVCAADEVPRSVREAKLALRIPAASASREWVVVYDDLGVYQLLADVSDADGIDAFVRRWLGPLVDHDAARQSELVPTLAAFLDTGGRYETAATRLAIGRSTLRYRLGKIRDLAGWDLADPDTRFQVHLAAKAWFARKALGG